jgi:hypothetical protein
MYLTAFPHSLIFQAECENEGAANDNDSGDDNMALLGNFKGNGISIRADHITKIAAELLMDFS